MVNIGLLKLELFAHGIHAAKGLPQPLTNPFGLVHLVLPGKIPVSVHLIEGGERSPYTLTRHDGHTFLEVGQNRIPVRWTPPLQSYQKKTASGLSVSDILTIHGDFIAVHPSHPCRFGQSGLSCRYCGWSPKGLASPPPSAKPPEPPPQRPAQGGAGSHPPFTKMDLIEAISLVLKEKRCDIVHLSAGHVETEDGGVERLSKWVAEIRRHLNVLISLDLAPPATNDWIDKTYAIGVDALYYDSFHFNPEAEPKKMLEKHKARQLEALAYAAKIFPKGAVLSHLVVGLEPLEETRKSIDLLIDHKVVPVLAYFPPYEKSALKAHWTAIPEKVAPLYAHLFERLVKTRMIPHWVQQYDVVLTPLEGRFFSTRSPRYHLALKNFYETGLGRTVRMGLASLRRHLRVREVPAP